MQHYIWCLASIIFLFLTTCYNNFNSFEDISDSDNPTDSDIDAPATTDDGGETPEDANTDADIDVPDTDTDSDDLPPDYNDTIGLLDDSFGIAGEFLYPSDLGTDSARDAVTTPDGSIFVTGYLSNGTDSDLLLMKLTNNGVLDTTFNGTGYITRHNIAGGNGSDAGHSIKLTPHGDLLISGNSLGPGGYHLGFLWKVSTSGVDDASFGTSGTFLLDVGLNIEGIRAMYDRSTGNIFAVCGYSNLIHAFRILANGSGLDVSFGSEGVIELHPARSIQPELNTLLDGTLMVAGQCIAGGGGWDACSWLVDTNGELISSYTNYNNQTFVHDDLAGGNGNDSWHAILPYPGNRMVLAGASLGVSTSEDELIARVNILDGSFDTSFGEGDGFWTEDVLGLGNLGRIDDAVVKQDGSIVAALEVVTATDDWNVAVIKLDANGVRDTSFASGTGVLQLGGVNHCRNPRMSEQPDGRILVFTTLSNDTEGDIVIWAVR